MFPFLIRQFCIIASLSPLNTSNLLTIKKSFTFFRYGEEQTAIW